MQAAGRITQSHDRESLSVDLKRSVSSTSRAKLSVLAQAHESVIFLDSSTTISDWLNRA